MIGTPAPDEIDPNNKPTNASEMTAEGSASYQIDFNAYVHRSRIYENVRKGLDDLTKWVLSSVSSSIQQTDLLEDQNLKQWYATLAASGKIYDGQRMQDARERYHAHLKYASKTTKKFYEWIQVWKETMAEGALYKVPEAQSGQYVASNVPPAESADESWSDSALCRKEGAAGGYRGYGVNTEGTGEKEEEERRQEGRGERGTGGAP